MFWIYSILAHLAFVLLLPLLMLHPKLKEGFGFRLGRLPSAWPELPEDKIRIWLHGASAGDLLALQPLILSLRETLTDCSIVVTTMTSSGMALARKGMPGVDAVGWVPYDLPWVVARFVRAIRPSVLVLEYAEVWPALLRRVKASGARIVLSNGRFHDEKLGRYRKLYRLIGNPLEHIDCLCMRSPAEAEHALAIGARRSRLRITGDTKFDRCRIDSKACPETIKELSKAIGEGPWWVAGSTHAGEESQLLDVFRKLREDQPSLRLLLVPRYPERAGRVLDLARAAGFSCGLRSQGAPDVPVVVLDTVGELALAYALATVVFVGGSLVTRGGQNILEPATQAKPVFFGPHMENFVESVRVLQGRGGIQVTDVQRLQSSMAALLSRPEELEKLGRMAKDAVLAAQGASRSNALIIAALARGESLP
ncbi:MAG: 3-deoxy-D-manno-octulosonic acid transferase [Deltaproteobacteria bacterium]|nr:3-deoxy-D-manno-octulosonic acid transferase [Deltaproteobacteria bacterium]